MDKYLRRFPAEQQGDLMIARGPGVAWQADMKSTAVYGDDYLAKVDEYDGSPVAEAVNAGRCAMLARHVDAGAAVLDFGAGSGAFVRAARGARFDACGFDVIPAAVERLRAAGLYAERAGSVVTAWDVLEHLEDPGEWLSTLASDSWLFVSLPVFEDLDRVRKSKHYRPGEHLSYWTADGFVAWMSLYGFRLIEVSTHEMDAGRDSIGAFAFRRDLKESRADLLPCTCGGPMGIDSYDYIGRPVEWLMRCRQCGFFSTPAATAAEAERLWKEAA